MKELIGKVYQQKLQDGTIEKIISTSIDDAVRNVCNSMFGYDGEARALLKDKIKPVMLQAIEDSNVGILVDKITVLLNSGLRDSELERYKFIIENLRKIYGENDLIEKYKKANSITLAEIFKEYVKHVEGEYSKDDFKYSEIGLDNSAEVDCLMAVEPLCIEDSYRVTLSNEKSEADIEFKIWKSTIWDKQYYIDFDLAHMPIPALRRCSGFELFLLSIASRYFNIEGPFESAEDYAVIEFDE